MGLRYNYAESVPRKPYYGNSDTSFRRNTQSANIVLPIVQAKDDEEYMGSYVEYDKGDNSSTAVTVRLYGQHTKIRAIQWMNNSANDWLYTININGYQIQSGTGSGPSAYATITTTDFNDKIFSEDDYVELYVQRTAGVGNVSPNIKIKGWNP